MSTLCLGKNPTAWLLAIREHHNLITEAGLRLELWLLCPLGRWCCGIPTWAGAMVEFEKASQGKGDLNPDVSKKGI